MLKAIDLFAGAGGFSTGARAAGAAVVMAANHNPTAVAIHQANHPETDHLCQDINLLNWNAVPDHDLMLASPCCQGHSRARGRGVAKHDESRQTAWCIPHGLEWKRPRAIVIENVPEFRSWERYGIWTQTLESFGYSLTENVLNAREFGVAQHRERLFIVGSLGKPITIESPRLPEIPASEILEWDHPDFAPIAAKPRAEVVMRQVREGRRRFGSRFLVVYNGSEKTGRSVERPLPTVTCVDRIGVVDGERIRFLRPSEARRAMGFPADYQLPRQHKASMQALGNAVCPPVATEIVKQLSAAIAA